MSMPDTRVKRIQIDTKHVYHENIIPVPREFRALYNVKIETWTQPFNTGTDVYVLPPKDKETLWVTGLWCEEIIVNKDLLLLFIEENRRVEVDINRYNYLGAIKFERKNSDIHVFTC